MIKNSNFTEYLFENTKNLEKEAFIFQKSTVYYKEFYSLVQNLCNFLASLGLTTQDPVFLLADNSVFSAVGYLATILGGWISVPLHPQTGHGTISYIFEQLNIKTVITQEKYLHKFNEFSNVKTVIVDKKPKNSISSKFQIANLFNLPQNEKISVPDIDMAKIVSVLIFTSGSTGKPKGVMLTHQNLIANTESIIKYLNLTHLDRMFEVLPYSYCYGASWLHTITRVGGTHILNNKFMFYNRVLNDLNNYECTGFAGVPSHFQILLRNSNFKKMTFPTLRFVAQAGGKLADVFIKELVETLPTTQIFIMYGQTEATARLSYLPPDFLSTKLGSIGKGIPDVKLEVLKNDKPVKEGEVGEIVASGKNIMLGYWSDPEETKKVLKKGKLHTGDLARVDEDGFIFIVDREKQIIKSGGHRISPKEIESQILKLPEVVECAVIGIEDEVLGEAPKAFIVLRKSNHDDPEETKESILKLCKKNLASFKIPKFIEFISELPKNTSNKVLVNMLKENLD